jgi:hypothetical protein
VSDPNYGLAQPANSDQVNVAGNIPGQAIPAHSQYWQQYLQANTGRPLVKKLAAIMDEVGKVPKTGYNQHFKYKFVEESVLLDKVREQFAQHNIIMVPQCSEITVVPVKGKNGEKSITQVLMTYEIVDGDTGDRIVVAMPGQGADDQDKGAPKAVTSAQKYALLKLFLITSNDDVERDSAPQRQRNQSVHDQIDKDAEAVNPNRKPISEAQAKRLFAKAKEHNCSLEELRKYMQEHFGALSTKELLPNQYQEMIQWIEAV